MTWKIINGEWPKKEERGKKNTDDGARNSELNLRTEKGMSLYRHFWAVIEEALVNALQEVGSINAGRF